MSMSGRASAPAAPVRTTASMRRASCNGYFGARASVFPTARDAWPISATRCRRVSVRCGPETYCSSPMTAIASTMSRFTSAAIGSSTQRLPAVACATTCSAKVIAADYAVLILDKWLATSFRGERHAERIAQIEALERGESLL